MNYLTNTEANALMDKAIEINKNSYCVYSKFSVSAAILTLSDKIFTGINIENASYGGTICAERIAIGNMISSGNKDIRAIAIYAEADSVPPCGMCRQFIIEFGENIIIIFKYKGEIIQKYITELLPYKFEL